MEYLDYIPFDQIENIKIYQNVNRLTLSQIIAREGCDYAITGTFYNTKWKPTCQLKIDGKKIVDDGNGYWGFCWNKPKDFTMTNVPSKSGGYANHIACCSLLHNGGKTQLFYNRDVGGKRGRTGVGIKGNNLVIYASKDGTTDAKTPEQLQTYMKNKGISDFIMFDGGGKVNYYGPKAKMQGVSPSQNLILVYLKKNMTKNGVYTNLRQSVVDKAVSYLGCKESDGSHKKIIDLYNSHKPLARGYKVTYKDSWCAVFVSAISVALGLTDIMPTECSCSKMIELYKALCRWEEDDAYTPKIGDLIMYDWNDGANYATTDDVRNPSHVGIVTSVNGKSFTVIEGNYNDSVKYRNMTVNGRYIRGYCLPDYESKMQVQKVTIEQPTKAQSEMDIAWDKCCDKGLFDGSNPTGNVTRRQLATVLVRAGVLK